MYIDYLILTNEASIYSSFRRCCVSIIVYSDFLLLRAAAAPNRRRAPSSPAPARRPSGSSAPSGSASFSREPGAGDPVSRSMPGMGPSGGTRRGERAASAALCAGVAALGAAGATETSVGYWREPVSAPAPSEPEAPPRRRRRRRCRRRCRRSNSRRARRRGDAPRSARRVRAVARRLFSAPLLRDGLEHRRAPAQGARGRRSSSRTGWTRGAQGAADDTESPPISAARRRRRGRNPVAGPPARRQDVLGEHRAAGTNSRQSAGWGLVPNDVRTPSPRTIQTPRARRAGVLPHQRGRGGARRVHRFGTRRPARRGLGRRGGAMPATNPRGTAAHANAETCFHSAPDLPKHGAGTARQ